MNDLIIQEQLEYVPFVIKIQSWYRGVRQRKLLAARGIFFKGTSYNNERKMAMNKSAILIQSTWRGYKLRKQAGEKFRFKLLSKAAATDRKLINDLSREIMDLKLIVADQQELIKGITDRLMLLMPKAETTETIITDVPIIPQGSQILDENLSLDIL